MKLIFHSWLPFVLHIIIPSWLSHMKSVHLNSVLLVHLTARAFDMSTADEVCCFGDRTKGLVFGVLVLEKNEVVCTCESCLMEGRNNTALVQ
jgi:hypothetical protein